MPVRRRTAAIVAMAFVPFAIAFLLDGLGWVDPVYIWGGRICRGARRIDAQCMVPPYALLTSSVALMGITDWYLEPRSR